jgi:cytoskeletal protein CcmA (bactofilin family)
MAAAAPSVPASSAAAVPPPPGAAPPPKAPPPAPLSGSLRLTGTSRLPNVRTLDWVARGSTKVVGDVEVGKGNVTGSLAVGGRLVARQLDLSGTNRIEGDLQVAEDLRIRGTFRTGGSVSARNAQSTGSLEVGGGVNVAKLLRWKGALEAGRDVSADTVTFQGRLAIQGKLTARSIYGEIESLSSVREIGAAWVDLHKRRSRLPIFLLPPPPWDELAVQRIEASEVHLAGVRVRHLRADRIFLGPDAHVEFVEGTILQRHKDAHVGPESESPPPPGLSR